AGSIEETLHDQIAGQGYFLMNAVSGDKLFNRSVPHRAIGVVYNPDYDRWSNYVPTVLARRYDAFIYLDKTTALPPLHLHPDEHLLPTTVPCNFQLNNL